MKLSRAIAAPLALSFALSAAAPVFAEDDLTMPVNDNQAFTCDAGDLSHMDTSTLVNEHLLQSTVFIRTSKNVISTSEGQGMEEFFRRFFEQGEDPQEEQDPQQRSLGLGSGFVIDGNQGYVVTNHHVIAGADGVSVTFYDADTKNNVGEVFEARVVGTDEETDIAVLQIDTDHTIPCVNFADSSTVRIFDDLIAIGNPQGLTFSVSSGVVSNVDRTMASQFAGYIQTDASINQGNSGGPSFNMQGEVIGVNSMILSRSGGSNGLGIAIDADTAEYVATQIILHGEVQRGWLGVQIQPLHDNLAADLGLANTKGAFVADVTEDGPAELAGIEKGDVILNFNGFKVNDFDDLLRAVANTPIGQQADVVLWRDGAEQVITAVVGDRSVGLAEESAPAEPENQAPAPQLPPQVVPIP